MTHQVMDTQWIGGQWTKSDATTGIEVIDPYTEQPIGSVPAGTPADVYRAVAAARKAFPVWSESSLQVRIDAMRRLVDGLRRRAPDLVQAIVSEVGAPLTVVRQAHVGLAIEMAESFLQIAGDFPFEREVDNSIVVREPAGVVASITPWNMPLLLTLQKIVPAMLAGCTVVHKPSEIAPLHAYLLTEAVAELDLPPGVFNLVVGEGPTAGTELARHPEVDLVSLTGSTRAGRSIAMHCADQVKRVHLELGGKNASIVLDDADLGTAVRATVDQACFNSGQTCLQWSRLLVPAAMHDEAITLAAEHASGYRVGPPIAESTDIGPLVSDAAYQRVNSFIEGATEEGADLACGGPGRPDGIRRGYFVRPTVFGNVHKDMAIARQEVFGPIIAVMPYEYEDDAVQIANSTVYGLHGAVWSGDNDRARNVVRRLRCGVIDINGGRFNIRAPFGGFKQSGIGRECGIEGLDGFCEIKSVQLPVPTTEPVGPRLRETT